MPGELVYNIPIKHDNPIPFTTRLRELFIDWLVISAYLLCLFGASVACYFLVLGGIPAFSELHSQLIATFSSVLVIITLFAYLDVTGGSIGKRAAGLRLYFVRKSFARSFLRNLVKFLPWQIGHMAVIHGIYSDFDTLSIVLAITSCALLIIIFLMGTLRRDRRHLEDMVAGTQVQLAKGRR